MKDLFISFLKVGSSSIIINQMYMIIIKIQNMSSKIKKIENQYRRISSMLLFHFVWLQQYIMIIKKNQPTITNFYRNPNKANAKWSVQIKRHSNQSKYSNNLQSFSQLNLKQIKFRLSQIFKEEVNYQRSSSAFNDNQFRSTKKQNHQYLNKTFMLKRRKVQGSSNLPKQKMEIINQQHRNSYDSSFPFRIKQIKVVRKDHVPLKIDQQTPHSGQIYTDRYYKVLSLAKSRFSNSKSYRKPSIPQNIKLESAHLLSQSQNLNNFVKPKNKTKFTEAKVANQPIQPWASTQQYLSHEYYNDI